MVWSAPTGVFGTLKVWDDPPTPFCSVHMLSLGIRLIEISDIYRPSQRWVRTNYAAGRDVERKKKKTDLLGCGVQGRGPVIWCPLRMQFWHCKWKVKKKYGLNVAIFMVFFWFKHAQIHQVHFFKHRLQFWAFHLASNRMHWLQSCFQELCFKSTRFLPFSTSLFWLLQKCCCNQRWLKLLTFMFKLLPSNLFFALRLVVLLAP